MSKSMQWCLQVARSVSFAAAFLLVAGAADAQTTCNHLSTNLIVAENSLTGDLPASWDLTRDASGQPVTDDQIQGYAMEMSVPVGGTVHFKINSPEPYTIDIYRLGYYGGNGARRQAATINVPHSTIQPPCSKDPTTTAVSCISWSRSANWKVPATAVSGVYIARLKRNSGTLASHIVFVVRDDTNCHDIAFSTSDTTWQGYNAFGYDTNCGPACGSSFYTYYTSGTQTHTVPTVTYDRPFATRFGPFHGKDFLFDSEYPMIRWLERNGYDVSYISGVDVAHGTANIPFHHVFLSAGHDEYWSFEQRQALENARDGYGGATPVNLAFFSGNQVYWKTRWDTNYRTMTCYKEDAPNHVDSSTPWTGRWRDPRGTSPASEQALRIPENELLGSMYTTSFDQSGDTGEWTTPGSCGCGSAICPTDTLTVPVPYQSLRFWANTNGGSGSKVYGAGTLGFEFDEDLDNAYRPSGLIRLTETSQSISTANSEFDLDRYGDHGSSRSTHAATVYKAGSGALVFNAGSVRWAWGLDDTHDNGNHVPIASPDLQQATLNILADMNALPATPQSGLVIPAPSVDVTAPTAGFTSPVPTTVNACNLVTFTGSANDAGGDVAGVEVSTDGTTWHSATPSPSTGFASWTYAWHPSTLGGGITIRARAIDDSYNIGVPSSVTVTVNQPTPTCALDFNGDGHGDVLTYNPNGGGGFVQQADSSGAFGLAITNATNATPIVFTTAVAHGLQTGALVATSGVLGNAAANDRFSISVLSSTTFAGFFAVSSNTCSVGSGNYSGGGSAALAFPDWSPGWTIYPADLNGDGLTDLIFYNASNGNFIKALNSGFGGFNFSSVTPWPTSLGLYVMDLDGDGLSDLFAYNATTGQWKRFYTNPAAPISDFIVYADWTTDSPGWQVYPARLNNDKLGDLALYNPSTNQWARWINGGPQANWQTYSGTFGTPGWTNVLPGDFNGDNFTDLIFYNSNNGAWVIGISDVTNQNWLFPNPSGGTFPTAATLNVGDFDGDGKADVLTYVASSGQWAEYVSDGNGGFGSSYPGTWSSGWQVFVTDLNGDGYSDVLTYTSSGNGIDTTAGEYVSLVNTGLGQFTQHVSTPALAWGSGLSIYTALRSLH